MRKIIGYIALFAIGSACQETLTIDLPVAPPALVIEGKITDQPGPYTVKLHLSGPFDEPSENHSISEATVRISDDQGNEEELTLIKPGEFQTSTIQGAIGVTYTLEVTFEGTTHVATSYLGPIGEIDSLVSDYNEESAIKNAGYYVTLFAQKSIADQVGYYKWRLFKNDSLFNGREFLYVDSDEISAIVEGLEFDYPYDLGDTAKCEMESLTKEAFDYYIQLNAILNNDGFISKSRNINPPTNFTPSAIGLFQTSAVSSAEIVIKE